jgi:hypothetical protein
MAREGPRSKPKAGIAPGWRVPLGGGSNRIAVRNRVLTNGLAYFSELLRARHSKMLRHTSCGTHF